MSNPPDAPPPAPLVAHDFHAQHGAVFGSVRDHEMVLRYGPDASAREYGFLTQSAGVIDLGFRSRLCLTGADRLRFLHGQVTNAISTLRPGAGCYAALVTAKGKMVSDLHVHCLRDELLLDFEPGLGPTVQQRLEQYVIADDVQIVDVAPHYTLWSVQGPSAEAALTGARLFDGPLPTPGQSIQVESPTLGEICCARHARGTKDGFDLFVPVGNIPALAAALAASAQALGGGLAGWTALEWVRIEAGLPRFGQDMDETNLPPEAGLESRAISYNKGCYIGQEIIARIRTYGQVAKSLRGLILPENLPTLPPPGTRLTLDGKEVGYITSSLHSPRWNKPIALGYVRKECLSPGTQLTLAGGESQGPAQVVALPFSLT